MPATNNEGATMTSIGIRDVLLLVAEHDRAIAFYRDVFGMEERGRLQDLADVAALVDDTHDG